MRTCTNCSCSTYTSTIIPFDATSTCSSFVFDEGRIFSLAFKSRKKFSSPRRLIVQNSVESFQVSQRFFIGFLMGFAMAYDSKWVLFVLGVKFSKNALKKGFFGYLKKLAPIFRNIINFYIALIKNKGFRKDFVLISHLVQELWRFKKKSALSRLREIGWTELGKFSHGPSFLSVLSYKILKFINFHNKFFTLLSRKLLWTFSRLNFLPVPIKIYRL